MSVSAFYYCLNLDTGCVCVIQVMGREGAMKFLSIMSELEISYVVTEASEVFLVALLQATVPE